MLPERFGRYEVLAELGDGAMGRVYTAWDPSVSRVVAVKTIRAEYASGERAAEYRKRFAREVRAAGGLSHPAIVRIYDGGDDYVVMEYVEGQTLKALLRERGRLEPSQALALLGPIAEAVDHAHAAGLVHRDIKPANIMVQPDGQPKLMDFGVVHVESSVMTATGQVLGSPSYMPPEQIMGDEATSAFDVYALAVVAYETLTGQPPFQGASITQVIYRVIHDQPPPPRMWNAALPARYDEIFARALSKDRARRFTTAGDLVAALDLKELEFAFSSAAEGSTDAGAEDHQSVPSDNQETLLSQPARAPVRRGHSGWTAAAVSAAAILLVAGWLVLRRGAPGTTSAPDLAPPGLAAATLAAEQRAAAHSPEPVRGEAVRTGATEAAERQTPAPPTPVRVADRGRAEPSKPEKPREGQLVDMGPGVTPPRRVSGHPAAYPDRALARREFGTVGVRLIVNEDGSTSDLEVTESAGEVLDEAVLRAIRSWRFEPATKDGVKVKVRMLITQTYKPAR
jgi:TonB family protein